VALDSEVAEYLRRLAATPADRDKVRLLREHNPEHAAPGQRGRRGHDPDLDVPDPYYGGLEDFETAYQIIERSGREWLAKLRPPAA
jgi:protein-tyrosine phosphatase